MVLSWSPAWGIAADVEVYTVLLNKFPIVFVPKKLLAQFLEPVLQIVVQLLDP